MNLPNFYTFFLFVLLSLPGLAIQIWAQRLPDLTMAISGNVAFEVVDSLQLESNDNASSPTYYEIIIARDSVFLVCKPLLKPCNFMKVYDLKGNFLTAITLETEAVTFDNSRDLPSSNGLYYFYGKRLVGSPPQFYNYYIAPNYIYVSNYNFWVIFSKTGKFLSQGYWKAYLPHKDTCYTSETCLHPLRVASVNGEDHLFLPIHRNWPEFWKNKNKYSYDYELVQDYYDPQNYCLAKYKIPKPNSGVIPPPDFSDGIAPFEVLIRLNKDWGKLKGRGSSVTGFIVAVDSIKKLIYMAGASEHQVRVYDWQGNFKRWIGNKGKHLAPGDTVLPIPPNMAKGLDSINFENGHQVQLQYKDLDYSLHKASYCYFRLRFDPQGEYLFRIYSLPNNAYKAHAKEVGIFPTLNNTCKAEKEVLQVISLKTGKVIYDELLSAENNLFEILQVNAPGDYWIFGGYTDDYEYAKLYRVKMTVKEE
jgi:hypothetical protein